MVVITLEKCPLALRGDLTKWLQEISPGVYVGQISARVRDNLWKRVCAEAKSGRATMVYSARNEQRYDFRTHNTLWEPIDFDGLKLMLRPNADRIRKRTQLVDKRDVRRHRRPAHPKRGTRAEEPNAYVVVDIETTGLDPATDEIIEIAAIRIEGGEEVATLSDLIRIAGTIPAEITQLTGIRQQDLATGIDLDQAIEHLLDFVRTDPIVMHNAAFDMGFIDTVLEDLDLDEMQNQCIDTLTLARKRLPRAMSHALVDMCSYFSIDSQGMHRALVDCRLTRQVFVRLLEL